MKETPMTDQYWDRLVAAYTEHVRLGAEHPNARYPDQGLRAQLEDPVEGESNYDAPVVKTQDLTLGDEPEVFQVRVYTPSSESSGRPLFVWIHGGAWAFGDLEGPEGDATAREVADRAAAVVVSVDYRLATQGVHFPIPLDDVVAAYRWARQNAERLGVDPARISLGGASAGGNLAAGAVLRLADDGDVLPAGVALAYPALHPVLPDPSPELQDRLNRISVGAAFGAAVYTPIVENYLGGPITSAVPHAMPGVADDLSVFPPTYIFNCEYDGLRSSGEQFAEQLRDAGVPVVCETIPAAAHGHLARPGLPQARQTHADLAAWVGAQVAPVS
jgi:acetyl esterase/lipase